MQDQVKRYNWLARQFHWLMVPLILCLFVLGLLMTELPVSELKLTLYAWHKWIGITVLAFVVFRLAWRFASNPPTSEGPQVPSFIHFLAKMGHIGLYVLLILIPLIGWLRSSTAGFEIVLFEVLPLPDLMGKDEAFSDVLALLHKLGAFGLLFLILGHIGAVVLHHKVWQDRILQKMAPSLAHIGVLVSTLLAGVALVVYSTLINPPEPMPELAALQKAKPVVGQKAKSDLTPWMVDQKASKLEFTATQKSSPTTGVFKSLLLNQLTFDPDAPENAKVEVIVDVASLSLGTQMIEQTLLSSSWFDVQTHEQAIFYAEAFESLGANKYRLNGSLTIKAISKPLPVDLLIIRSKDENLAKETIKASGKAIISRTAYGIGQGEWASTQVLDDEVTLTIDIVAIKQ